MPDLLLARPCDELPARHGGHAHERGRGRGGERDRERPGGRPEQGGLPGRGGRRPGVILGFTPVAGVGHDGVREGAGPRRRLPGRIVSTSLPHLAYDAGKA